MHKLKIYNKGSPEIERVFYLRTGGSKD
jgi:hypothetical protein